MTTRRTFDAPTRFSAADATSEARRVREPAREDEAEDPDEIGRARTELAARSANAWRGDAPTQELREDPEDTPKVESDAIDAAKAALAERSASAWKTKRA